MARKTTENSEKNFGISMEMVNAEPLNEAELDQLADLFADAIVRKMLSKEAKHDRRNTTENKSDKP